jgi:type IV pilus assembly protein PilV
VNMWFRKSQTGAGLIEVMVSLLILAVGLLGMLSLQANGLNSNQRAIFVTEAQLLAEDMAGRLLAFGSRDFNGNGGANTGNYGSIDVSKVASVTIANDCSSACTTAETLTFDTEQWQQSLSTSSLPRGRATVTWLTPLYTVRLMWDQERTGLGTITCSSDNCFEMEVRP